MSGAEVASGEASGTQAEVGVDMNLEVVTLPVADVDRAKDFYESLGWRFDIDLNVGDVRTVQFTPPHSGCSIQFGSGGATPGRGTDAEPGSAQGMLLVVEDIDAARDDLVGRGVDVSEVQEAHPPGFEEAGRSYFARAEFKDPDGNNWVLQQITERLPGRTWED
jgi:catechol 2,3-dioxygenase-like lactoylglutathione lyase family enzyme